jgi:outer membrane protein TolC
MVYFLVTLPLLTACATYQEKELPPQAVAQQNQTPALAQLQIQAAQIKHPLLKPVEFDLADGLSADEAAILAVLQNPELRLARDKHGIADAQLLQANLLPNPRLAYNVTAPSGGLDQDKVQGYGLSLDWEFTALLTHAHQVSVATAGQQAINLQIAWQEWQIAQAAKLACYQLQVYDQQQLLLAQSLQRLQNNKLQLQQAAAQGLATLAESTAADNAADVLSSRLQSLQHQQALQQQRLNRSLGRKADESIPLQSGPLPYMLSVPNYQQLTQELDQQRLDLLALQQGYLAQDEQVRIAILQQFPKISIGPITTKNNSNYYTMGAGIALSLPIFDHNQGAIALATASRQTLFDEYSNRDFQSKADIAELLSTITSLNTEIQTSRDNLQSLDALLQVYTAASSQGQIDQPTYYTAWNNLADKKIELLTLQLHLLEARTALETATGRYAL